MSDVVSRIRSRVNPLARSGSLNIGRFYGRSYNLSLPVIYNPWQPGQVLTWSTVDKFTVAEVTRDQKNPGPPYKTGGAFYSVKYKTLYDPSAVYGKGVYLNSEWQPALGVRVQNRKYVGGFNPPDYSVFGLGWDWQNVNSLISIPNNPVPDLSDWGNKAYKRLKPHLEKASGFVFVAELRELPKLFKETAAKFSGFWNQMRGQHNANPKSYNSWKMAPRRAANDFLAVQFGWLPFLNDIRKFHNVVDKYWSYISHLATYNGKGVRKRVTLSEEFTSSIISSGTGYPVSFSAQSNGESDWFTGIPSWQVREEVSTSITAVGKFSYYLPYIDLAMADYTSKWNSIKRFMLLYGLRVSPANIYKAIPWTWLIDWVSNLGDHVDHWNDAYLDSVVCHYLYVMQHKTIKRTYTWCLPFRSGTVNLVFSRIKETKQRTPAGSPYGFSLSLGELTLRQHAILVALKIKNLWIK